MPLDTDKLRELITARGLTQQQLARACGWRSQSRVSDLLTARASPTMAAIDKLAAALGCSAKTLVR